MLQFQLLIGKNKTLKTTIISTSGDDQEERYHHKSHTNFILQRQTLHGTSTSQSTSFTHILGPGRREVLPHAATRQAAVVPFSVAQHHQNLKMLLFNTRKQHWWTQVPPPSSCRLLLTVPTRAQQQVVDKQPAEA